MADVVSLDAARGEFPDLQGKGVISVGARLKRTFREREDVSSVHW